MKDQCPNCGHRFGLTGAPFALPPGQSRAAYYCPECGSQLQRIDSAVERVAAYVGYGALLIASGVTLWNLIGEPGDDGGGGATAGRPASVDNLLNDLWR